MTDDDLPPDTPWYARLAIKYIGQLVDALKIWFPMILASIAEVYGEYQQQINDLVKSVVPAAMMPHLLAGAFVVWHVWRAIQLKGK